MEEELEKVRKTFLDAIKQSTGMSDTSRQMSKAFDAIVKKKQKRELDSLTASDKGKFKMLMEKWEVMEERQRSIN